MTDLNVRLQANYQGAWLTDVDDTLLPSGKGPDKEWLEHLAEFIRVLKQHDVLWVPVSGVAIAKMGPRLLYQLPQDVLTHVLYYGGEGSTKSFYDYATSKWCNDDSFQRNFTDAQSLALIGEKRLSHALSLIFHCDEDDQRIMERITDGKQQLKAKDFSKPCLIDEMEAMLDANGFAKEEAETYYRGGALSWMMMGDKSVELYKGEKETEVRQAIRDFADDWIEQNNHLRDLGEPGVHMPYKHATRGIKVVLEGNDKGRAAEDLINNYQISSESILFTGNEIYVGGNDNSVRRIAGVRIISVGEIEDPGVIDGGVQVGANRHWMDWITQDCLQNGTSWYKTLEDLNSKAEFVRLTAQIDRERTRQTNLSELHSRFAEYICEKKLAQIIIQHRPVLENTRHALVTLRNIEYKLLARLAVLEEYHYDEARKIVSRLMPEGLDEESPNAAIVMADKIKDLLLPELKGILRQTYVDQLNTSFRNINKYISNITKLSDVLSQLDNLFTNTPLLDYSGEKSRATVLVSNWENRIEKLASDWYTSRRNWKQKKQVEQQDLFDDERVEKLTSIFSRKEIYYYFRRLIPRIFNFPHLKDLDKPTIVLVAGTSGVGKSTISQHISKTLGISTYFSTDVTSRSVMREAIRFVIGDTAENVFPELYGSSFDVDDLSWFYGQSLLGMMGTSGSIDRLVKENVSAVIDGVSLIPGMLADKYFEIANIVWVVASMRDEEAHYKRMGTRSETGVSRGGAERYRQKIKTIRSNHDRMVDMGKKSGAFIVDNGGSLSETLEKVLQHIKTPFSDRGLPVDDALRDECLKSLKLRVR